MTRSKKCTQISKIIPYDEINASPETGQNGHPVTLHPTYVHVQLIVEHNVIVCNALLLEGYNGNMIKVTLKPVQRTTIVTAPHSQEQIDLLSQAKLMAVSLPRPVGSISLGAAMIKKK